MALPIRDYEERGKRDMKKRTYSAIRTVFALILTLAVIVSAIPVSTLQVFAQEAAQSEDTANQGGEEENSNVSIPASAYSWCGHYYKLYSEKMTPAAADAWCKSQGGYLATITSAGERGLIASMIEEVSKKSQYTIGGRIGSFEAQKGFENANSYWDTGEKDTANYWRGNYYPGLCEKKDNAYRILGYYQSYSNTPYYRAAGYWWEEVDRDYTENTYGFICEWGDRIDIADAECSLDSSYAVYDGTLKTPVLTIKYNGVTLERDADYTCEYTNNLELGTATILIAGTGRFKGTTSVTFSIEPKMSSLTVKRDEEITTISCKMEKLPAGNTADKQAYVKEYLENYLKGFELELSKEDQEKIRGMVSKYCISNDGTSAEWWVSVTGDVNGKISAKVSSAAGQTVSKSNITVMPPFEINTYRADYILDNQKNLDSIETFVSDISPSDTIVAAGKENNLDDATFYWNLLTKTVDGVDDASKALNYPFEKKEMYMAILFNIFEQSSEESMLTNANKLASKAKGALQLVTSTTDTVDDLGDFSFFIKNMDSDGVSEDFAAESAEKLINGVLKILKKENYTVHASDLKGVIDGASTASEIVQAAQKYLEYLIACEQLYAMSDDMQTILNDMYARSSSNTQLRQAIREVSSIVDNAVAAGAKRADFVAGEAATKIMLKKFWDASKKSAGPIVNGYLAAYNAGKLISNKLTASDKLAESYVKMDAMLEIEQIAKSIYASKKAKYLKSRTPEDAGVYLAALDVVFYCLDADCEYANDFCKAADSAWISKLVQATGDDDIESLQKSIQSIRNSVQVKRGQIATDWIYQLETDYPKQYPAYKNVIEGGDPTAVYKIQCPVNVEVFDASGHLAASVIDHKPYWDGASNLAIAAIDDGAEIWFYGNEDYYSIRYTGTDTGSMDISVLKYDGEGSQTQKVQYNNVPLTADTIYTSEENLGEQTGNYTLTNAQDQWNLVDPDVDTASPVKEKRTVTVQNGYLLYDVTEGPATTAECYPGETVDIYTAQSSSSSKVFEGWKVLSGNVTLADAKADVSSFVMPDGDVEIQAVYAEKSTTPDPGDNNVNPPTPTTPDNGTAGTGNTNVAPPAAYPQAGAVLQDAKGGMYTVVTAGAAVSYAGTANKKLTSVSVPSAVTINGVTYKVTAIADNAFKNNKKLKKVTISNSIVTIEKNAFAGCSALTSVKMGGNVKTIGKSAFQNCTALKKITIPSKVQSIGSKAFYNCKSLTSVTVKTKKLTTKSVGAKAFTKAGSKNYKKLKVKTPAGKYAVYKKLLKKKGLSSKAKVTK